MSDRRRIRLFVDLPLNSGQSIPLPESQAHYVTHVMRLKVGEGVNVFNGRDGEWDAVIDVVSKKGCWLTLQAQLKPQTPEPDVWLAFAPIKKARVDLIVEKATELGVSVLQPVFTHHTNAERVNIDRLRLIATEAAEQCERLAVPEVRSACSFADLIGHWPKERRLFVMDETGGGKPIALTLPEFASQPCGFLVGPEGGFAHSELDALTQLPFVSRVGLGPRILRAETAALAALVNWQSLVGDWR